MGVESELVAFLDDRVRSAAKQRDIEIVAYFYGFREVEWPTLEDAAGAFGLSNRERPRQIIQEFRDTVQADDIPTLSRINDTISQRQYWLYSGLVATIKNSQLGGDFFSIQGLFNLMKDVGIPNAYDIYTLVSGQNALHPATRSTMSQNGERFITQPSDVDAVSPLFRRVRTLPGQYGIANLAYLGDSIDQRTLETYWDLLIDLIRQSPFAWLREMPGAVWFNFEDRDNVLVNYGEKVFSVIGQCEVQRLAEVFHNALYRRSLKYAYPPVELIQLYLSTSRYFAVDGDSVRFVGQENTELSDIERDVVEYLRDLDVVTRRDLSSHLSAKGHSDPLITKAINTSPFVYVDKSSGRRRYAYSLVGAPGAYQDRYLAYLRELANLEQTDTSVETKSRREQRILQRWLFEGKTTEHCAICGDEHMVSALRVAHKKKRSQCTEAERRDPYIVMPLCVFGCDFLYEDRHIVIKDGMVKVGSTGEFGEADLHYMDKLVGRMLDDDWLQGASSYFD